MYVRICIHVYLFLLVRWLKRKKEIDQQGPQQAKDYRLKPGENLSINIGVSQFVQCFCAAVSVSNKD